MHQLLRELNRRSKGDDYDPYKDSFQTPDYALEPLLPYIPIGARIWEPACGDGNIVSFFCGRGFDVVGTDIKQGQNFFHTHVDCDIIITNPPYSNPMYDRFLERCYRIGKPFALLSPVQYIGGSKRQGLFEKYGVQIVLLGGRVSFTTPSRIHHTIGSPTLESAWFCNGLNLPSQITFAKMRK